MHSNGSLFLIGIGIGLSIAFIGGLVEYWLNLRPGVAQSESRRPGCLLYVAGGLAVAGIIAMIASAILNGGVGDALIVGAGVLTGFYSGFIGLFCLWFLLERN